MSAGGDPKRVRLTRLVLGKDTNARIEIDWPPRAGTP
jgi:hypothetical protein